MTTPLGGLFRGNEKNNTNENNRVKNLNWWEADQLVIYKDDWGVEPGTYQGTTPASGQSGIWTQVTALKSSALNHSAILPPSLC